MASAARTVLARKPTVTGLGPFAAVPTYVPLGRPSRLLNVALPTALVLNIVAGHLVALDGNLDSLTASRHKLDNGVQYDQVWALAPASLLVNGGHQYWVAWADNSSVWRIVRDASLVCWSGHTLALTPAASASQKYTSAGRGVLVFKSRHQMYEIQLAAGEEVAIYRRAVIASTAERIEGSHGPEPLGPEKNRHVSPHAPLRDRDIREWPSVKTIQEAIKIRVWRALETARQVLKPAGPGLARAAARRGESPVQTFRGPGSVLVDTAE